MILSELAALLEAEGGLLAGAVIAVDARPDATPHGDLVARGPRAIGHEAGLPMVIEAVREAYLLHHGRARIVSQDDPDLALLAGDWLYALGLQRLARAGDLTAVMALADLIALGAQAQAAGDEDLAQALWTAGAVELGWGPATALTQAKAAARRADPDAASRLLSAAHDVAGGLAAAH